METTVDRIVIMPATVGRWRKNHQPFSVLRSFEQAKPICKAHDAEVIGEPVLGGLHHVYHLAA